MTIRPPSVRSALGPPRLGPLARALLAIGLSAAAATVAVAQPLDPDDVLAQAAAQKSAPRAGAPSGANPYLSFLPVGETPDYAGWNRWLALRGKEKRALQPPSDPTKLILGSESEPNGTQATADFVFGLGSAAGEDPEADLSGTVDAPPAPTIIGPFAEDNGAIPLGASTAPLASGTTVRTSGTIGDGPYGSGSTGSGDFDFFVLPGLAAGDSILIDVDTPVPFCCDLDPMVGIWDAAGNLLAFNDDQPMGGTYDSYLVFDVPAAGTYYVSMGAYLRPFPSNPFDSSSGLGFASEGTYDVTLGINVVDEDYYSFDLEPGDVIAANLLGTFGTRVTLFDPSAVQRIGSGQEVSFQQPGPFPGGGIASFAYVVETAGTHAVHVSNVPGAYTIELRVFRPLLEQQLAGTAQTLFVDFDGATFDRGIFNAPPGSVTLSPLSAFLASWGLTPADENAVIDGILDVIEENLSSDMRVFGANGDYDASNVPGEFDVVLLNSRDHADPFGDPNVSRLIVGGTIPELGISTIGIAESIDPGNFATSETAVILLDLLSAPSFDPNSLNQFAVAGSATKVDLVARGVGNVASHEAGHFFANWHTAQFNALPSIMDQGGNLPGMVGVGTDLTLGTGDDVDVDLETDTYVPNEGFTGVEDTLNAVAFGLSTGAQDCPPAPLGSCPTAAKSSLLIKDKSPNTKDSLVFKWQRGSTVLPGELGDPLTSASYRICVYDADGLVRKAMAPAAGLCDGDPCWSTSGSTGFRYRDKDLTPDGTQSISVKSGTFPRPKITWKAKGDPLADGPLELTPPVVVEIGHGDGSSCFGSVFAAPSVITNTAEQFKANAP
jgi:hypothetical protein